MVKSNYSKREGYLILGFDVNRIQEKEGIEDELA